MNQPVVDPTQRFSTRVDDYIRYRPQYPDGVIEILRAEAGLTPAATVADIGSGTGIATELFLRHGHRVFGVEPNREMRAAAEERLAAWPGFRSVDGTAEATTLPDASVDWLVAAQAFHWFEPERTRAEFHRILRPGGWVVLLWNRRLTEANAFARAYEGLLQTHSADYAQVRHERIDGEAVNRFFGSAPGHRTLPNTQSFDFPALRGRLLSSSYAPLPGTAGHEPMIRALEQIFRDHQRDGRVEFLYTVEIYFGRL